MFDGLVQLLIWNLSGVQGKKGENKMKKKETK
jgi:hypothetical protein